MQTLIMAWHQVVQQEGCWDAHRYEGCRPVACDLVGFFRPRRSGCLRKHYQSGADQALPAIVFAGVAAMGSVGTVRLPLLRGVFWGEAEWQRRAFTHAGAVLQPDEVLVVEPGSVSPPC
jgi:hypothetical protein